MRRTGLADPASDGGFSLKTGVRREGFLHFVKAQDYLHEWETRYQVTPAHVVMATARIDRPSPAPQSLVGASDSMDGRWRAWLTENGRPESR